MQRLLLNEIMIYKDKMTLHIGDTITDEYFPNKQGLVKKIDDYDACIIVHVLWDDGTFSDFSVSETTKKVD